MSNTVKALVALLIVLGVAKVEAFATSDLETAYCKVIAQKNEETYKVIYKGAEKSNITVSWKDVDGHVVFKETMKSIEGFVKQYDLSLLPQGDYEVTVASGEYKHTETVKIGDLSGFNFDFKEKEGNVIMTGVHPAEAAVTVVILDADHEEIFKESITSSETIQKKFNFQNVKTEQVTFVIYAKNKLIKEETIEL